MITVFSCLYGAENRYEFTSIHIENQSLIISFQIEHLINDDILNGMKKGMTAALEFQVQLFRRRAFWTDRLYAEKAVRLKITYDPWLKNFIIQQRNADPAHVSAEQLNEKCSGFKEMHLIPAKELPEQKPFYIAVRTILRPMSVENIEEIRKWLAGEVREIDPKKIPETKEPVSKTGNWLMGILMNIAGFKDRIISAKSDFLIIENDEVKLYGYSK